MYFCEFSVQWIAALFILRTFALKLKHNSTFYENFNEHTTVFMISAAVLRYKSTVLRGDYPLKQNTEWFMSLRACLALHSLNPFPVNHVHVAFCERSLADELYQVQ